METLTLEDLKRKNAEEEATKTEVPQAEVEEAETEAAEVEAKEPESDAETEQETDEEAEVEAWQVSDEQGSQGDGQAVPVAKHAQMRAKLKGKLSEKESEIEQLRAEIEALKSGSVKPVQSQSGQLPPRPKIEDFDYDDNAYNAALDEWHDKRIESKLSTVQQTQAQKTQIQQQQEALNRAVDGHYERAAKLAESSGIRPEMYQQADYEVRSMIERLRPGQGDLVTDQLISVIGDGSEKVMYFLGRNKTAQAELQAALMEDPTGLKAIAYLGRKAAEVSKPVKRTSQAPKPPTQLQGDEGSSDKSRALKKKYSEAHKKGDSQTAYDVRKQARSLGVDVSNW